MAALEKTLYEAIQAALDGYASVYYEAAPATASPPFVVWSLVDSVNDGLSLNSRSGMARVQFDCYDNTATGRTELRDSVARWAEAYRTTISGVDVFPDSVTERSFRKGDDPLFRAVVDLTLAWRE